MHTFIDRIITFSLRNKFFIFFLTVIAVIAGVVSFLHTPVDAFPDVTNTKVTIITQWPGRSAEEIEKFITIPVEIAMNPVQKKTDIRSTTLFGLSVIHVMFDDDVDDFYARQQVYNLLNDADLPEGVTPEVQPLYGPTGEIFRYTLRSDKRTARELKTFQDWVIERKLRAVPGVADIVSFGGEVKTFEVSVNPNQLINYGVTTLELYDAIAKSNINVGGDVITRSSQAYVVRGIGLINDVKEIENIVVKNINGTPILVKNLADVHESSLPRLGQVGRMEEDDVVQGIVVMRKGENPSEVIAALKDKIADIQQNSLPEDVRIVPFYDRPGGAYGDSQPDRGNLAGDFHCVDFYGGLAYDGRGVDHHTVGAALCLHLPPGDGDECESALDGGDRLRHHYRRGGRDGGGVVCRTRQESS